MSRIKDEYWKWLLGQLTRFDQIVVIGALIWLKWCEDFPLPKPDLKSPARWTSPIFFIVGLVGSNYYRMGCWWAEIQIRWALRMMVVE